MKVLVSGGAGFIGSHVVDAYVEAGHDVLIVDDLSTGHRENLNPAARFYEVDIRSESVREIFERERPEALSHHAAQMDVRRSVADPIFDAQVNLVGLLNLMETGRQHGLKRVVFASSGGTVYGEQNTFPATENHSQAPISPYGVAKLASEYYLYFYACSYDISYLALRYANVYGPRQDPHGEAGVVAIFAGKLLRGDAPTINGTGTQSRDYVFVEDVAQANLRALTSEFSGPLNIGTGVETDVNELFRILRAATGSDASERHGPGKPGEQQRSVLDPQQAKSELGWVPRVGLEDGLKRTVEYFRSRL